MTTVARGGRVVLYARVSTAGQVQFGHGLDAQRDRLSRFVVERGLDVVEFIVDEGLSGTTLDRPGVQRVVELAKAGEVDAVVVTKADRISRNVRDLLNLGALLEEHGVALLTVDEAFDTSTPIGKALHMMRITFAALEADLAASRTREALAAAREKGVRLGRPPLGWTKVGDAMVPDDRFELVERAYALSKRDGLTMRQIADLFNAEGVATGSGRGRWQSGNVTRLVHAREKATAWCPLPVWAA